MKLFLSFLLFSFIINFALIIPFINLLYRLKFQKPGNMPTDFLGKLNINFHSLHRQKAGTPTGGGLLIIITTIILYILLLKILSFIGFHLTHVYPLLKELFIIIITFISFGLLGLYDDVVKFAGSNKEVGLRLKDKLLIQLGLAFLLSLYLYKFMGISIINIPFLGVINFKGWFLVFSTLFITFFSNAVNITDGLDGLAAGLLMIVLFAFVFLSYSILDIPLTLFLALWLGGLLAFLYFNIYPARIFMGDVGSLSFGALLGVLGILLGKVVAVTIISGLFIFEASSSLIQIVGKKYFHHKPLPLAPFHLFLQKIGWPEPKIVFRAWLLGIVLALFGLWLAQF